MTALVAAPARARSGAAGATGRQLVVFELRRFARSPVLWAAVALTVAWRLYDAWGWLPDMTVETIGAANASAIVAVAALVVANLATSRDRRQGAPATLAALPRRAVDRTRAVALAAPVAGAAAAAIAIAACLAARWASGPVAGRFDAYEALSGVAVAALAAAAGVALGRWLPALVVAPLAGLLWLFGLLANSRGEYGGWLLPVIPSYEPDWGPRSSGWHLVYLCALVVLVAAVALFRHGVRPLRVAAALAALAVAVPAVSAAGHAPDQQMRILNRVYDAVDARRAGLYGDRCRQIDGISYCALPRYVSWTAAWAEAVHPVVAALPPGARTGLPAVRQTNVTFSALVAPALPVLLNWSTDPGQGHRAWLAGGMAAAAVRLGPECDARGRAGTLVALWLLGQAGPVPPPGPLMVEGLQPASAINRYYGAAEAGYARRLLARADTRQRIWASWDRLADPRTTLDQALPLLGLRPERFPADPPADVAAVCRFEPETGGRG
ncbi:hypothetical protein Sru01_22870 [Sphaerisporangium rufum]|uniref:Uncharacterized protein n=1 Tax=Sphaerisporangium rufum TaxID=1381558 RepID=A0A919R2R4_9ACTN|nr:hypothetical protein [Sphaerisporangium rufum]GII77305.1 hypothetical protein Sru01_22870 [Sphaerisporangium rufum]